MNIDQLSNEEINQQINCVAHEIRNHLSICDMYSQIIKKNLEKSGIENFSIMNAVDCIQKSVQIIGTNLLDLKSLNSSNSQVLDFNNLVCRGVELSKAYVVEKNIQFEMFVKNTDSICVDENRFLACIVNIIKNGIEAIDIKGKITIMAEVKDGYAIIKISNDGRPIPKDKQDAIFTTGYTTKKTGCGLGLPICKRYLNSLGADLILVRSLKYQTQFEIKVPVYKNNNN